MYIYIYIYIYISLSHNKIASKRKIRIDCSVKFNILRNNVARAGLRNISE